MDILSLDFLDLRDTTANEPLRNHCKASSAATGQEQQTQVLNQSLLVALATGDHLGFEASHPVSRDGKLHLSSPFEVYRRGQLPLRWLL